MSLTQEAVGRCFIQQGGLGNEAELILGGNTDPVSMCEAGRSMLLFIHSLRHRGQELKRQRPSVRTMLFLGHDDGPVVQPHVRRGGQPLPLQLGPQQGHSQRGGRA